MPDAQPIDHTIEYLVISGYLVFLVLLGLVFRKFNANVSDYFRNGCRGTWWLVGASAFMTAFSAVTFTAMAGAAFESGFGVTIIFIGNALGFFLVFAFVGPWYRQLRSITAPEVIRKRFGRLTQQIYAWFNMILGILYAALWLTGLGIFAHTVFGYDLETVILATGAVVLIYSVFGGSWAVMATDFLQLMILIPLSLVVAFLALAEVGGISGFFHSIDQYGLTEQFRFINDPAVRFENAPEKIPLLKYGMAFAVATIMWKTMNNMAITAAPKYFAVKDGREARKAALLACILMILGTAVWFVPPMVARMIFFDEVMANSGLPKPEESAYAVISMRLLPAGMTGLMVVAMFAATMSSMDSGLNRNAAIFTRDIFPGLWRWTGLPEPREHTMFRLSQFFSLVFGIAIVAAALYFAQPEEGSTKGVFEYMLDVGALLGAPLAIPMLLALFIRRAPWWSAIVSMLITLVPSSMAFFEVGISPGAWAPAWLVTILDETWTYQDKIFANTAVGVSAFLATMPFWRVESPAYKAQVTDFFETMRCPIDFEQEVGQANDPRQLKIIGAFCLAAGLFICALMALPNPWSGRMCILFVGGSVATVGVLMMLAGRRPPRTADTPPAPLNVEVEGA